MLMVRVNVQLKISMVQFWSMVKSCKRTQSTQVTIQLLPARNQVPIQPVRLRGGAISVMFGS